MESKEPGLGQPEQQELSPFAEKIQEFLNRYQEEFSENRIQEKVNQVVELKGNCKKFFECLNESKNEEDITETINIIRNFHEVALELKNRYLLVRSSLKEVENHIKSESTQSEYDYNFKQVVLDRIAQLISSSDWDVVRLENNQKIMNNWLSSIEQNPSKASNNAMSIMTELTNIIKIESRLIIGIKRGFNRLNRVNNNYGTKSEDEIFTNTPFEDKIEEIKYKRLSEEETEKQIEESKGLQEPWERQLDPLYEAGILKYI